MYICAQCICRNETSEVRNECGLRDEEFEARIELGLTGQVMLKASTQRTFLPSIAHHGLLSSTAESCRR